MSGSPPKTLVSPVSQSVRAGKATKARPDDDAIEAFVDRTLEAASLQLGAQGRQVTHQGAVQLAGAGQLQTRGQQPAPGGGAAAAVSAALAASLTAMVVRLSLDRPKYADYADLHREALDGSDATRLRFLQLAWKVFTGQADRIIASHEAEELMEELEMNSPHVEASSHGADAARKGG